MTDGDRYTKSVCFPILTSLDQKVIEDYLKLEVREKDVEQLLILSDSLLAQLGQLKTWIDGKSAAVPQQSCKVKG